MSRRALISLLVVIGICFLSCSKEEGVDVPATGITISLDKITLSLGESITLDATISPSAATDKTVIWASSNPLVAEVSQSGLVTAKSTGVATIQASTKDGTQSVSSVITVVKWFSYSTNTSELVNDIVNAIAFDSKGNKWIGTVKGLSVFDGTNWTTYNVPNSGIISDWIISLAVDQDDNIWVGTNEGLSKFDGIDWTQFTVENSGLPNNLITSVVIDANGNTWIGTPNGASKFDGANWTSLTKGNSGLIDNNVYSVSTDKENNLWFGTAAGASKFDGDAWFSYTPSNGLAGLKTNKIIVDDIGIVWFATSNGLSKLDGSTWTTYFSLSEINTIGIDASRNIWISLYNYQNGKSFGVAKYDMEDEWTSFTESNSLLLNNTIFAIGIDSEDNKWFGTLEGLSVLEE